MKAFVLLLSLAAASLVSNAQTPAPPPAAADPPGLQVVKFSWSKERIDWSQNPFGGPIENFHEMQFRARAEKRAVDAKRSGNTAEMNKLESEARTAAAIVAATREKKGPPRYGFLYKVSVKNDGAKAVREIDWDYVFTDAATGEEVGRREFTSEEKIEPGRKKELSFLVPSPPARTISVYSLNQKESASLTGRVVLVRILYADGTVWQAP
jgi:hypothetical protein